MENSVFIIDWICAAIMVICAILNSWVTTQRVKLEKTYSKLLSKKIASMAAEETDSYV